MNISYSLFQKGLRLSGFSFLAVFIISALLLAGCQSTPNVSVNIGDAQVTVTSVQEVADVAGEIKPQAGFRLIMVSVDVVGISIEEMGKLKVTLAGEGPATTNTTISNDGTKKFKGWVFSVPTDATTLPLAFPDGMSVDVTSMVKNISK